MSETTFSTDAQSPVGKSRGGNICLCTQVASQGGLQAECTALSIRFSLVVVSVIDSVGSFICEYLSEYISL